MDEILKALADKYHLKLKELEQLKASMDSYSKSIGHVGDVPFVEHNIQLLSRPGYPMNEGLLEKFKFLDETRDTIWAKSEMVKKIIDIEGDNTKTLNSLQKRLGECLESGELIRLQIGKGDVKRNTFYTTHLEWVNADKKNQAVLPEHLPSQFRDLPVHIKK